MTQEITARREADARLRESEERFRGAFEKLPPSAWRWSASKAVGFA